MAKLLVLGCYFLLQTTMNGLTTTTTIGTSTTTPPKNATLSPREMFSSKVLGQHVRYCSSSRLCKGYRHNRCWRCAPCQCDELCPLYGDCCPDMVFPGVLDPSVTLPPKSCESDLHGRYTDGEKEMRYNVTSRYFMVTSCPEGTELVMDEACTNSPLLPPVIANNVTYRNKHCAVCHGVKTVQEWSPQIDCNTFKNLQKLKTPSDVLEFALKQKDCRVTYAAPAGTSPRGCYHDNNLITKCNETGQWQVYDAMLEWACGSYTTVKEVGNQTYKNVFCYICNSDNPKLFPKCKFGAGPVSFSALLDFSSALYKNKQDGSARCSQKQLYDGQRDACRDIICSQGKQLVNRTCIPIFGSAKGLVYEFYFDMVSNVNISLTGPEDLLRLLPAGLKEFFPYTVDRMITIHDFVVTFNTTDSEGMCLQATRKLSIYATSLTTSHIDTILLEDKLLNLRQRNFTFPMQNRNISFETTPNENARIINQRNDGRVNKKSSSCIVRVSMNNPIQADDQGADESEFSELDTVDPIRVSNLLTCPQIRIEKDEYNVVVDSGIQLDWKEDILALGQYEEDDDGDVTICLENFKPDALLLRRKASEAEVIVSIVCTTLSLVCLLLTFITYCLFKSLRSIPGKNNINLTITLFAAQLLYLVGSGRTENHGLCEAVGIFIHYLWLAVFCAMAVCSFHMFRVFSTLRNREDSSENRRLLLQYCVFIYGLPALLVVINLVVHIIISDGSSIGYGGNMCYLSTPTAIGVAFGIPVALTVIINLVFFILTIRIIKNTPKIEKSKQDKHHAIVYIKLSTLTGITWTLGFVAFIIDWYVLRYLFIVVNAGQGVFIFLSFVCNRRVHGLYTECCCGSRGQGTPKPTPASDSSNTTKSTPAMFTISKSETKLTNVDDPGT